MKKMIWIFDVLAVTFIFLSLCVGVSVAQPLPYSLSGHILDNESEYVVGAKITLVNERTNDILELVSTTNGEYQQDAYNFPNHYKNGDSIRYNVTYEDIGAVELADIDISKGGTKLDITLTKEGIPTPNPTPKTKASRKTTTHMYTDTDGDGISDNEERVRGWDKLDPCIPNSDSVACKAKTIPKSQKSQISPEFFSPFEEEVTPSPTIAPTIRPKTVTPKTKAIPGFTSILFIVSLFIVVIWRCKKQ